MGMVTYDVLNSASAQSCKTDRLTFWKVPCLSRQSIAVQIVAGTCIYMCEALRDCFTFTPPSFGKECTRQCFEDAAVKL